MRRRLILMGFATWDAVALLISYNLIYFTRLGRWEGVNLGLTVITFTWLGFSYLLGRYSPPAQSDKNPTSTTLTKTLLTGFAIIALFVGHSWIYQIVDAQTRFRGFLAPLVASSCFLSTLGQSVLSGLSHRSREWILIGSSSEIETIRQELSGEKQDVRSRISFDTGKQLTKLIGCDEGGRMGIGVGTLESYSDARAEYLLRLREKGERVIPLLSWCELELQRIPPELIHIEWMIQAEGFGLRPGSMSWRIKRLGDVVAASALIALTIPILAVVAALIWMEDKGPVFYRQIRSGLYGKPIRIWKLRSMRVNAEKDGAQWSSKGDARITRVGRLIRATRIDELPQLIAVVNGDMSLIGPRPERPEIEEILEKEIPNYRLRHWIRPGLSGWSQVCHPYGASIEDSRKKLSYDLYYMRNAGFALDLLIFLKTIKLVSNASGATPSS